VVNLVCRAKAVDLTPDVTEVSKKKWASQKCTLAEYRQAGGWPSISNGSSSSGSEQSGGGDLPPSGTTGD